MLFEPGTCAETVSILRALIFGADGACVDIGPTSLLGGVAVFIGAVVLLRFAGATVLRRLFPSLGRKGKELEARDAKPADKGLKRMPYESPIRSTGAWGSKPR